MVELNPPADAAFGAGYELITVAEDDDTVVFTGVVEPPAVDGRHHGGLRRGSRSAS